jgi:hypothetical protein
LTGTDLPGGRFARQSQHVCRHAVRRGTQARPAYVGSPRNQDQRRKRELFAGRSTAVASYAPRRGGGARAHRMR